jgi:YgiT-type zinc finger domain-containing protein
MKKICSVCGKLYDGDSSRSSVCSNCKNTSPHQRGVIEWYNRQGNPLEVVEVSCAECGEYFHDAPSIEGFSPNYEGRVFCSHKCKTDYIKKHGVCKECGKPLSETDHIERIPTGKAAGWFCSEECKERHVKKRVIKKYCRTCGKEILTSRDNIHFCSSECREMDVAWKKNLSVFDFEQFLRDCAAGNKDGQIEYLKELGYSEEKLAKLGF